MIRRRGAQMNARNFSKLSKRRSFDESEGLEAEVQEEAQETTSLAEDNLGNLISILDPEKVDGEVVDAIAETTGSSKETVEGLVELVANANKEMEEGADKEQVVEEFSRKAKRIFARERLIQKKYHKFARRSIRRRFADEEAENKEMAAATAIVSAIDDVAMAQKAVEAVSGIINAATGIDQETVENLVEMSKDAFACGTKFSEKNNKQSGKARNFGGNMKKMSRPIKRIHIDELYDVDSIGHGPEFDSDLELEDVADFGDEDLLFSRKQAVRQNIIARRRAFAQKLARRRALAAARRRGFADGAEGNFVPAKTPNPDRPVAARRDVAPQNGAKDSTVASQLPLRGTPGIQQNPLNAELDPKEGEAMQSAVPAGEAMATQNELATVQNLKKVPAAASNFQRRMAARSGQKDEFSMLRSVLGAKYIP